MLNCSCVALVPPANMQLNKWHRRQHVTVPLDQSEKPSDSANCAKLPCKAPFGLTSKLMSSQNKSASETNNSICLHLVWPQSYHIMLRKPWRHTSVLTAEVENRNEKSVWVGTHGSYSICWADTLNPWLDSEREHHFSNGRFVRNLFWHLCGK